uniref:Uncharacterized protein n=1 Tax=Mycena chlorophos TaxID=658473 RepID=A0ABQ0LQP5_MYCCL|nr:predicted protein [Mycena chlorophos]
MSTTPTTPPTPSRPLAFSLFFVLLCLPSLSAASTVAYGPAALPRRRRGTPTWPWLAARETEEAAGFYNPLPGGGAMLTEAPNTFPPAGEPLNIIFTSTKTPAVLVDQEVEGGFRNFMLGVGFAGECLGQHEGDAQKANLGDGHGYLNETAELRWDYGDPSLGTCTETIEGGNHFRYWIQNGPDANSSAIFMATSYEQPLTAGHNIIQNGYNLGRDWLVGNITGGTVKWAGYVYSVDINYVSGLLANSSIGVNHNDTVPVDGKNAVDGLVAVLEVAITTIPKNATSSSGARRTSGVVPPRIAGASTAIAVLLLSALYL